MEIKFMKTIETNHTLTGDWSKNRPMTEEEVLSLEEKYNNNKKFPLAFREFLLLAGKGSGIGIVDEDWEMLQEDLQEFYDVYKFKMDRPIFPFDRADGGAVFTFFYLDEDKEDPDCYLLMQGGYEDKDSPIIKSANGYTFSGLINEAVRRIKEDLPF